MQVKMATKDGFRAVGTAVRDGGDVVVTFLCSQCGSKSHSAYACVNAQQNGGK